jgi:hypothetical protein
MPSQPGPEPERRYDKGERRYKHVGKQPEPEIEFVPGNPRMWVGKCPSTLTLDDNVELLNEAIAGSNGDRELPFPKKLYVVHEGAIYEGQTTDRGKSYHGYPFRGKLAQGLLAALREMATEKDCEKEFDRWVKKHIEVHGA